MLKMPKKLVINTSPLISLVCALGDLRVLTHLYDQVIVPRKTFVINSWLKNNINIPKIIL